MRLTHLYPGVRLEQVQAKTGFPLDTASPLLETEPPTEHELQLLREQIDPLGIRRLELLGGARRRQALRDILQQELALTAA
jgi:hypothetical protein